MVLLRPDLQRVAPTPGWVLPLFGAHAAIGVASHFANVPGQVHVAVTTAVALWAMVTRSSPLTVAAVTAYVVGSEVFWRMTEAGAWEQARYLSILLLTVGLIRHGRVTPVLNLAAVYLAALLPGLVFTVLRLGPSEARRPVVFNMLGPLLLMLAVAYFASLRASGTDLRTVLWAITAPIFAIAARAAWILVTEDVVFISDSNAATAGGFGPNQVSGILGLGFVTLVVLSFLEIARRTRILFSLLALWMIVQASLTFSRGGVLSAVIAVAVGVVPLARSARVSVERVAWLLAAGAILALVLVPRLDQYTGDLLVDRFTDLDQSGRGDIVDRDLAIWGENRLTGVGVGMSGDQDMDPATRGMAAHSEYSRLLAEHGVAGLIALGALIGMVLLAWRRRLTLLGGAFTLIMTVWSITEMQHAAMRIAAISFVFGLGMLQVEDEARPPTVRISRSMTRTGDRA
jgi:hypothetical protein